MVSKPLAIGVDFWCGGKFLVRRYNQRNTGERLFTDDRVLSNQIHKKTAGVTEYSVPLLEFIALIRYFKVRR
jgi:hypothetical protein